MEIEEGNAGEFSPRGGGWLVGFGPNVEGPTLRRMAKGALAHTIGVKWMAHQKGDPNGEGKPVSEGCTLSMLVGDRGDFRIEFAATDDFTPLLRTTRLRNHGDYVIWGEGLHHRWYADEVSTILTVRWVPVEPVAYEPGSALG